MLRARSAHGNLGAIHGHVEVPEVTRLQPYGISLGGLTLPARPARVALQ